jgi:hypothetical protein
MDAVEVFYTASTRCSKFLLRIATVPTSSLYSLGERWKEIAVSNNSAVTMKNGITSQNTPFFNSPIVV